MLLISQCKQHIDTFLMFFLEDFLNIHLVGNLLLHYLMVLCILTKWLLSLILWSRKLFKKWPSNLYNGIQQMEYLHQVVV